MTKVKDIVSIIEQVAPLQLQEEYDNAGYQVGNPEAEVTKIITCLDITEATIDKAIEYGAQLIVSHHPLLFRPIKRITPSDYISRTIIKAIKAGITLYSAHTNLDNAYNGVNYRIAEKLELSCVKPLASLPSEKLTGIENAEKVGSGVIGILPEPYSIDGFIERIKEVFQCECIRTNKESLAHPNRKIKTVALCGGSGADFIRDAERQKADVYLTGEIGYHRFFGHDGILLVEAGHFETEQYTRDLLKDIIKEAHPEVEIKIVK